jgi:quercetin dioxygenase-like cupin family protein
VTIIPGSTQHQPIRKPRFHEVRAAEKFFRIGDGWPATPAPPVACRVAFRRLNASEVAQGRGPHPAVSEFDQCVGVELGISAFGLYQVELPGGAETVRHDHRDDGAEDAYAVLRGSGTVVVDGNEVAVAPGDFIAVTPESTRYVRADEGGLVFIAICAPTTT